MAEFKHIQDSSSSSQSDLYCVLNEDINRPSERPSHTKKGGLWSKQHCFLLMCGTVILFSALLITVSVKLTEVANQQDLTKHQYSKLIEIENEVANLTLSLALLSSNQQDIYDRFIEMFGELKADLKSRITNLTQHKPVLNCKAGWQLFLSNCYQFSSNKVSWQTARSYCDGQGTLLLILGEDSREWDFIVKHAVHSSQSYWIGLTDAITGHWRWVDGTPYTMNSSQWEPGEPNNWLGEEDCGELTTSGKLNDGHCSKNFSFICKAPANEN
ncbi:C-type lectin domain family 4 member E isoform X2 [Puntigrus tetrazona]|nr:C-type lectin domain family 4 member E isoform X2 [Puntigrus tetrazona]